MYELQITGNDSAQTGMREKECVRERERKGERRNKGGGERERVRWT